MRLIKAIGPWALLAAALVVLFRLVTPVAHQRLVLDAASLAGILLLAVPAIRLNEQGRLIERVRSLQAGIRAMERALQTAQGLKQDVRQRQELTLQQRKEDLQSNLDEGAWTPWVHYALYSGYVLLLGAAAARVAS